MYIVFFTALLRHHQGDFDPKKIISLAQGKIPNTGIFSWKLNLCSTGTEFHTQGNFEKLKVLTHYSTEPTNRGTLKNSKSPHTTPQRSHTGELWKISNSPHTTAQGPHTGEYWIIKVPTHHSTGPIYREIIFPIGEFAEKNNLFQHGSFLKTPSTGIFREKPISPVQGQ